MRPKERKLDELKKMKKQSIITKKIEELEEKKKKKMLTKKYWRRVIDTME